MWSLLQDYSFMETLPIAELVLISWRLYRKQKEVGRFLPEILIHQGHSTDFRYDLMLNACRSFLAVMLKSWMCHVTSFIWRENVKHGIYVEKELTYNLHFNFKIIKCTWKHSLYNPNSEEIFVCTVVRLNVQIENFTLY